MFSDPFRPNSVPQSNVQIKPTDEDVVRALFEIEKASTVPPPVDSPLVLVDDQPVGPAKNSWFWGSLALLLFMVLAATFAQQWLGISGRKSSGQTGALRVNAATQASAEQLLGKLAANESGAADRVLDHSTTWTGKTRRTPKADQSILIALNLPDL